MTCERYWREGIVLVERGLADPHRDGCEACTRAHASRQELVDALPLIGASETGDPQWQRRVWQRIDRAAAPTPTPWRWRPQLAGVLALACVVALWLGLGRSRPEAEGPQVAIIQFGEPTRSPPGEARVGDRLQVTVGDGYGVWIYREKHLVLQCGAQAAPGCAARSAGLVAELVMRVPGRYTVLSIKAAPEAALHGVLDDDRAALESGGLRYQESHVTAR